MAVKDFLVGYLDF